MQPTQQPTDFDAAVEKLETAITTPAGELRPISRIEFELLDDGAGVRWNLWEESRRLYSATGKARDVSGFLAASKMIMEMRAGPVERRDEPPATQPTTETLLWTTRAIRAIAAERQKLGVLHVPAERQWLDSLHQAVYDAAYHGGPLTDHQRAEAEDLIQKNLED